MGVGPDDVVDFVIKRRRGKIERKDAGNPTVKAVLWCNEFSACVFTHLMSGDRSVTVFVNLWNQLLKRQFSQHLSVGLHGLPSHFFSNFQTERIVVIEVPVTVGQVQPGLEAFDVHPCVGHGPHRSADLSRRDVLAFDVQLSVNLRLTAIGDVEDREFRQAVRSPVTVGLVPTHGVHHGV